MASLLTVATTYRRALVLRISRTVPIGMDQVICDAAVRVETIDPTPRPPGATGRQS